MLFSTLGPAPSIQAESETVFFDDPKSKDGFTFQPDGDHWKVIWAYKGIQLTGRRK